MILHISTFYPFSQDPQFLPPNLLVTAHRHKLLSFKPSSRDRSLYRPIGPTSFRKPVTSKAKRPSALPQTTAPVGRIIPDPRIQTTRPKTQVGRSLRAPIGIGAQTQNACAQPPTLFAQLGGLGDAALPKLTTTNNSKFSIKNQTSTRNGVPQTRGLFFRLRLD